MSPMMQLVGAALVHFVWQGALLTLATAIALRLARRPGARYAVGCAGLAAMLAAPVATIGWLSSASTPAPALAVTLTDDTLSPAAPSAAVPGPATSIGAMRARMPDFARAAARPSLIPAVVTFWLAGVAFLIARLLIGWWQVSRLHRGALSQPASRSAAACARIAALMRLARVPHIVDSALVEVPTVVGWVRPVVLLPLAALANLSPAQLDAILAHELAHIRRHDYLVNVLQTLTETLLFYHPGVWWVSSRVRAEREHCCDQIAVETCGDPDDYARALVELESWRVSSAPLALAATGGPLFERVRRIMQAPAAEGPRPASWLVVIALVALFTAGAVQWPHASQEPQASATAATADHRSVFAGVHAHLRHVHDWMFFMVRYHIRALTGHGPGTSAMRTGGSVNASMVNASAANPAGTVNASAAAAVGSASTAPPNQIAERGLRFDPNAEVPDAPEPPDPPEAVEPGQPPAPPVAARPAAPPKPLAPLTPLAPLAPRPSASHDYVVRDTSFLCFAVPCASGTEVIGHGNLELTADLSDVASLSEGGSLIVRRWSFFIPHTVEVRSERGRLVHAYYVAGLWRPFGDEARNLLATQLRELARRSPIAARPRVRQALATRGVDGVLADIKQLEGDFVRGVFFRELLATPLDVPTTARTLTAAGQLISSDFELSRTLRAVAPTAAVDETVAAAYVAAADRLSSDFEHQRALLALLRAERAVPIVRALVAGSVARLGSDYEKGRVLRSLLGAGPLDAPEPFFAGVRSISSDFEKGRVLRLVLTKEQLPAAARIGVLQAVASMSSDFERSRVLRAMIAAAPLEPALRSSFLQTARGLGSSYEQDRVLAALVRAEHR